MDIVTKYGSNDFAAFPSHHAAWAFYASLFFVHVFGKKYWYMLVIPIIIAFASWYGAEHYVIDSIAGFIIAFIAYKLAVSEGIFKKNKKY